MFEIVGKVYDSHTRQIKSVVLKNSSSNLKCQVSREDCIKLIKSKLVSGYVMSNMPYGGSSNVKIRSDDPLVKTIRFVDYSKICAYYREVAPKYLKNSQEKLDGTEDARESNKANAAQKVKDAEATQATKKTQAAQKAQETQNNIDTMLLKYNKGMCRSKIVAVAGLVDKATGKLFAYEYADGAIVLVKDLETEAYIQYQSRITQSVRLAKNSVLKGKESVSQRQEKVDAFEGKYKDKFKVGHVDMYGGPSYKVIYLRRSTLYGAEHSEVLFGADNTYIVDKANFPTSLAPSALNPNTIIQGMGFTDFGKLEVCSDGVTNKRTTVDHTWTKRITLVCNKALDRNAAIELIKGELNAKCNVPSAYIIVFAGKKVCVYDSLNKKFKEHEYNRFYLNVLSHNDKDIADLVY